MDRLVYLNYGDVNFADYGRLVAEDPVYKGYYYVICCDPVYDTDEPTWHITQDGIDLYDDWFDIDNIKKWAGEEVVDDPYLRAMCVVEYYGSQASSPDSNFMVNSAEGERFLNSLIVVDKVYWGADL